MLDATQPWLPLLDDEPRTDVVVRRIRRQTSSAPSATSLRPDSRVARQAFLGVASFWALSANEALRLLGEPLSSEAERTERMNGVLGAHRSLRLIAPEPARYIEFLRRSDPAFGGVSMLEVMLQEGVPGIARVRAHLLAQITR